MPLQFEPTASFDENLARFKAEAESLDPECARILFDHMATLLRDGDVARNRQAFNQAVLAALETLT